MKIGDYMASKNKHFILYFLSFFLVLTGCNNDVPESEATGTEDMGMENQAYTIAMEKGLEELDKENFERAAAYFEIAFEEQPEAEQAKILLQQTEFYIEAIESFEEEAYDDAQVKAEMVKSFEDGSDLLVQYAQNILNDIEEKEAEKLSEEEALEEFKGIFVEFKGKAYESSFSNFHFITEEMMIFPQENAGITNNEITSAVFEGETLILDLNRSEANDDKVYTKQIKLTLSSDENGYKYLTFDSDYNLYPITVDDMLKSGLDFTDPDYYLIPELREYDEMVPRSIDYLARYSDKQIEYAQVWLTVMENPDVSELGVYFYEEGEPVIPGYEAAHQLIPEKLTYLTGGYGYEGAVAYSNNGDGSVNVYNLPERLHDSPEEFPRIIEEALQPRQVDLNSYSDEELARLIERIHLQE